MRSNLQPSKLALLYLIGIPCAAQDVTPDARGVFAASAYTGVAVDTFAAQELTKYLNPGDSGLIKNRGIFGVDFAYRAFGDENRKVASGVKNVRLNNLWIYGQTLHGVRSADVDCQNNGSKSSVVPLCKDTLAGFTGNLPQQAVYMLRNATSVEGAAGLRWEFLGLQQQSSSPASLYVKAQAGFLNVAGVGGDVVDAHHIGIGAIATKGDYQNSYLEFGFGRTDLFLVNKRRRFKIDGYLERDVKGTNGAMSFFLQMHVDSDMGRGSDSVQTFFGVNVDLSKIFGGN